MKEWFYVKNDLN
jgi:hypothetical protein